MPSVSLGVRFAHKVGQIASKLANTELQYIFFSMSQNLILKNPRLVLIGANLCRYGVKYTITECQTARLDRACCQVSQVSDVALIWSDRHQIK